MLRNGRFGSIKRPIEPAGGFGPIFLLVMPSERVNLPDGLRRIADQGRDDGPASATCPRFASIRAMLARSRCRASSPDTIWPAATSASAR